MTNAGFWARDFLLAAAATLFLLVAAAAAGPEWKHKLADAVDEAVRTGRPVLIRFTASWCGPCKAMEKTTLRDPQVVACLAKYSCLCVDIDEQEYVTTQFAVDEVPTFLVVDPKTMKVLKRHKGTLTPAEFVAKFKR